MRKFVSYLMSSSVNVNSYWKINTIKLEASFKAIQFQNEKNCEQNHIRSISDETKIYPCLPELFNT